MPEKRARKDLALRLHGIQMWLYFEEARNWSSALTSISEAKENALKHAYWTALCASDSTIGAHIALDLARAHEFTNKESDQVNPNAFLGAYNNTMDLFNNEVGAQTVFSDQRIEYYHQGQPVIRLVPDRESIRGALFEKLENGELMIWDGYGSWDSATTNRFLRKSNHEKYYPTHETTP